MQRVIRKITFVTLQTTNVLIQNPSGLENNKIVGQQVDTIAMLGHENTQLAQLRRNEIKPSLKAEYSAICSVKVSITTEPIPVWGRPGKAIARCQRSEQN